MSRISWNVSGSRFFEVGVDRGVLYVESQSGVPWIGLTSVYENAADGNPEPYYIDGVKYLNIATTEEFEATVNAYTYPLEFSQCDGTAQIRPGLFFGQQKKKSFGLSYRTKIGNDISSEHGYKIHLVYDALASPSSKSVSTLSDSTDVSEFSWDLTTTSKRTSGYSSTAHVVIDSRFTNPFILGVIENILYGDDSNEARLPTPEELVELFDTPIEFTVTDNGSGTYTIACLNDDVKEVGQGIFNINHSTVVEIDENTYIISD